MELISVVVYVNVVTAERHTDEAHGAPLPLAIPRAGHGSGGTGANGSGPRRPGSASGMDDDDEGDRSMMTIGEESVDRGHDAMRGGSRAGGGGGGGGGDGGGGMRTLAAGAHDEDDDDEEEDDVELRMAIEASRAALGM